MMPNSCCAVNCANRKSGRPELVFYSIPTAKKNNKRRNLWLNAIKRENWPEEQIKNARLCSEHFISGKKSDDPQNPDYVPSIFPHKNPRTTASGSQRLARFERTLKRKRTSSPTRKDCLPPEPLMDISVLEHEEEECDADKIARLLLENKRLKEENVEFKSRMNEVQNDSLSRMDEAVTSKRKMQLLKSKVFRYKNVQKMKAKHLFYTGVSEEVFDWLLSKIKNNKKLFTTKKLSLSDHLFLVLTKLRLGLKNRDITYRFDTNFTNVSKIFRTWIKVLADFVADNIIIWPEKPALRKNLPRCFHKHYRKAVCIIDCTEIFIERPLSLNARAQTWSNYKNNNTVKYLIACTPTGAVSFVSNGWGGRVSDKEITVKSGFLDLIERGDQVLADRGFTVEQEIATQGGVLEIPSFTKGKSQLSANEVDSSRQIANVRIHVERVIGRLRKFNILNTTIPISQADLTDEIVVTIAGLVNLCPQIVS